MWGVRRDGKQDRESGEPQGARPPKYQILGVRHRQTRGLDRGGGVSRSRPLASGPERGPQENPAAALLGGTGWVLAEVSLPAHGGRARLDKD